MAYKISELANLTSITDGVYVPVVDTSAPTLYSRKTTASDIKTYVLGTVVTDIANVSTAITTANVGVIGYVNQSNVAMKGYVDGQISTTGLTLTAANTNMKAYVDGQITAANGAIATANVGVVGYVDAANVGVVGYVDSKVSTANVGMKGYVDAVTTNWTANAYQQQALIGNLQASAYSNVNTLAFLTTNTLPATFGGTGLTAVGTSGNVLTSNGNAWVSQASVIGINQTWQDVTANRVAGTTYTNSTGRPIMFIFTCNSGTSSPIANVNGITFAIGSGSSSYYNQSTFSAIIPDGNTYSISSFGAGGQKWAELR